MTKEMKNRIHNALAWYEGTDGSERENAANEMYDILLDIYNKG